MTWSEYYDYLLSTGVNPHNADNVVGHKMDLYESWEWDDKIPFDL